jgi:putative spermidine/putrescine transport system ATP-binding protein
MGYENLLPVVQGALQAEGARWPVDGVAAGVTHLAWRPAAVPVQAAVSGTLQGQVLARSYLGETVEYLVATALGPIKGTAAPDAPWHEGDTVGLLLDATRAAHIGASNPSEPRPR